MQLSLNADIGEGFGRYNVGQDAELIPLITAANIACGMHAGDPVTMARTVRLAMQHDVSIGAHPGFNDLWGFGRRPIAMSAHDIELLVTYQIGALMGIAAHAGAKVRHVKPHGALNNIAETDRDIADAIARSIRAIDRELVFVATAGSEMIAAGDHLGLRVISEVYADRAYGADGRILSRAEPDALLASPELVAAQLSMLLDSGTVRARTGAQVPIIAETICIHSDNPNAIAVAHAVRKTLHEGGVTLVDIR